jgi:hypothetical protein
MARLTPPIQKSSDRQTSSFVDGGQAETLLVYPSEPLPALEIDSGLLDGPEHRAVGVTVHLAHGPCQSAVAPFGHDTALDAEGGAGVSECPVRVSSHRAIVNEPGPSVVIHKDHDPTDGRKTLVLNTQIRERRRRRDASGHECDSEPSHEPGCVSKHHYLHGTKHNQ